MAAYYDLMQMIDIMALRLKDHLRTGKAAAEVLTQEAKVVVLNQAMKAVIALLDPEELTELREVQTGVAVDANGKVALSALENEVFSGTKGIEGVLLDGQKFCDLIAFDEYRTAVNANTTFSILYPKMYFAGGYVYTLPADDDYTADIYYIRVPTRMELGASGNHDNDVDCELNGDVQEVILDMATGLAADIMDDDTLSAKYLKRAYDSALLASAKQKPTDTDTPDKKAA